MKISVIKLLQSCLFLATCLASMSARAQTPTPGCSGTVVYTATGMGCSPGPRDDQISWQTFVYVVAPVTNPGFPAGTATFETWATDNITYNVQPPPVWPTGGFNPTNPNLIASRFHQSVLFLHTRRGLLSPSRNGANAIPPSVACQAPGNAPAGNFPTPPTPTANPTQNCLSEEVRRNEPSYNYVTGQAPQGTAALNTVAGLTTNFPSATPIAFPGTTTPVIPPALTTDAIEVKIDWIPVNTLVTWLGQNGVIIATASLPQIYFMTTDQSGNQYAMLSMHISLKDRPDWLWATFEHQLNPGRCDTMGCFDQFGMQTNFQTIAPNTVVSNTQYPSCAANKTPALLNMLPGGARGVWANYCLKDSQTQFTQTVGPQTVSILNGDSVVERILANVPIIQSSCISCHAYAAFNNKGCVVFPNLGLSPGGPIGTNVPQAGQKQYDFVWGLLASNTIGAC